MFINCKKVKELVKASGKQVGKDYLERLDYKVREMVQKSIENVKGFKRLTATELL